MRYGFVIDQRKCIGCHACTVACKEENQVPLGAFRTWVKYIERGRFPDTRRYFAVLRCNHCDDAPCVAICPTVALYRRADGIVDFDGARCIGCKSCMQACPYDALYIDPSTRTAAKCNYCAHRIEVGLEPACVIVCPEQAIVAGDLDDAGSRIARLVAREQVQVRKAEQGTRPKVFYLGADAAALTPHLQAPAAGYLWAERSSDEISLAGMAAGARDTAAGARPVYDAARPPRPWGGRVAAYLWTKSIATGVMAVVALGVLGGRAGGGLLSLVAAPILALVFLTMTAGLLVFDLKRPDRFHYLLIRPNWRSSLVWGTWILIAYGVAAGAWLVAGLAGGSATMIEGLALPTLALALAAAGYSAFLFGQAEGRDFWQSPLLLPQLLVAAVVAGAASLLIAAAAGIPTASGGVLTWVLGGGLIVWAVLLLAELGGSHANADTADAARLITRGPFRGPFWGGVIVAGIVLPILLLGLAQGAVSAALALAGLWLYEEQWVKAGQSLPLS